MCDKIGVVGNFNNKVRITDHMNVLIITAPVKTSKELDKLRFLCYKMEGVVRYSSKQVIITQHVDVLIKTAAFKTSTELDKLRGFFVIK